MKRRCYNKKASGYSYYGGRGLTVHKPWIDDFQTFYLWCISHGYASNLELDRINNDLGYNPENCRFITPRKNKLNSRLLKSDNTSGYRGVYYVKSRQRWVARITIEGNKVWLGSHATKRRALNARNRYIMQNSLQDDYMVQIYRPI